MTSNKVMQATLLVQDQIPGEEIANVAFFDGDGNSIDLTGGVASVISGGVATQSLSPHTAGVVQAGGHVGVDATIANVFELILTASGWHIDAPTGANDSQPITFRIRQDATGSRTVVWDSAYDFGAAGAPTLSTVAHKFDLIQFSYDYTSSKACFVKASLGFG